MYGHLSKYAESRSPELKVLSISRSERLARLLGFADPQIIDASYPDYNILRLPFKEGEFDAVVSDQVLEHVEGDPQRAIDETFRVLKPGGLALHTTCFINPIHSGPNDYWRFTPDALKFLAAKHGEVIDVGGWGNPYVWLFVALGLRFEPMPHARWHPAHWVATKNVRRWPIVTWILVKKGEAS
ncbi:MAG: class I SAM-dependent methyltransferase [Candidatus Manganitrophaceae bacterium]|nr:MAG: class I SAM-dependent methyltransferase [Candidatus Manganitrophaceae bacterium]